jgi:hypothetical protein
MTDQRDTDISELSPELKEVRFGPLENIIRDMAERMLATYEIVSEIRADMKAQSKRLDDHEAKIVSLEAWRKQQSVRSVGNGAAE